MSDERRWTLMFRRTPEPLNASWIAVIGGDHGEPNGITVEVVPASRLAEVEADEQRAREELVRVLEAAQRLEAEVERLQAKVNAEAEVERLRTERDWHAAEADAMRRSGRAADAEIQRQQAEVERLREALLPFASPRYTTRDGRGSTPETDTMTVDVEAGDWMRACVALGRMDADQLRNLPAHARPTDKFIDSLKEA